MDGDRDTIAASQQSLLIGTSNSHLAREELDQFKTILSLKLQRDATCVHALSELFSYSSPIRHIKGDTLFLECFVNDVIMAHHDPIKTGDHRKALSLLCADLVSTKIFRRLILIDLWPAALKTDDLAPHALRISQERAQILAELSPTVDCERIELGRDSPAFDNPAEIFHLNQTGLEAYAACIRTRLSPDSNRAQDQQTPRKPCTDEPWSKAPMLYCNATRLATTLLPDHPLETDTDGLTPEVYLPIPNRIELRLPKDAEALNLLSISYRETSTNCYISIRNSRHHYIFNASCGLDAPCKKVIPIPFGQLCMQPDNPLILESCLAPPPGAKEITRCQSRTINTKSPSNGGTYQNKANEDRPGLFGLTFDADASRTYAQPCRPTQPSPPLSPRQVKGKTKEIRLFSVGMWPQYQVSDHAIFKGLPGINVLQAASISEADAVLVGVFPDCQDLEKQYQQLIKQTDKPLILYTNEHCSEGVLPGIDQLNFSQYFACISHYHVTHPAHAWSPMAANWFGWQCLENITKRFRESRNQKPLGTRRKQAVFCYTNDSCQYRNRAAELLLPSGMLHSCGGLLNNCGGKTAPPLGDSYLTYCTEFKGYMAFENSSFPGYLTEKALFSVMAGCKTFYWGDATIDELFSEVHCINLTGLAPEDSAKVIAMHLASDHENNSTDPPFKPYFQERLMAARDSLGQILLSLV